MVKITLFLLIWIGLLGTGCQQSSNKEISKNAAIDSSKKLNRVNVDGVWILTNYLDSILQDQTFAKHRLYPIAWGAITFDIEKDSLYSTGLLYGGDNIRINTNSDSIGVISTYGKFQLRYDRATGNMEAMDVSPGNNNHFKHIPFIYRRVADKRLRAILSDMDAFKMEKDLYQLFVDSLIAGNYQALDKNRIANQFNLKADGSMTGFSGFNQFRIHDYFGTRHPYGNFDAIIFDNSIKVSSKRSSLIKSKVYNWVFEGDTLALTELVTENLEDYTLGKKKYRFLRKRKSNSNKTVSIQPNPFKLLASFPNIKDTIQFIKELRSNCQLEVDDIRDKKIKEKITYYEKIHLYGSYKDYILLEYDYGDGCMASYPWKYQILFTPAGKKIKAFFAKRFELIKIFPNQSPFLLTVVSTAKGNGGHEIYQVIADTLQNVYDGEIQTYDAHQDNKVFEPNELLISVQDKNKDGFNDIVFNGKFVLIQAVNKDGFWYDSEINKGKSITYSINHPFKKIPVNYIFLYNKKTGHFEEKEDYSKKYAYLNQ